MQILSAEQTRALLPYQAVADAIRDVLQAHAQGQATAPPRQAVPLAANGTLLLMPATTPAVAITKLVTVHPSNAALGLPSVQGEVLVLDPNTGQRLFLLDGATVTARRTAALSLLAAQMLAPIPAGPLLIVGAGTQARAHLEAFQAGLNVQKVYITSRTFEHAQALAAYAQSRGVKAQALPDPAAIVHETPLIVTATTSRQAVLPETVHKQAFIAAVGAYRPEMAEIPGSLVKRCRVYVDTLEGAQTEAGDLLQANVDWQRVTPLAHDVTPPVEHHGPILFKSVGHALWDLAAALVIQRRHAL